MGGRSHSIDGSVIISRDAISDGLYNYNRAQFRRMSWSVITHVLTATKQQVNVEVKAEMTSRTL